MVYIDNKELLQKALEEGIINLETVQEIMQKKERERLLKLHKYKIFFSGKEGRWKTTIPDSQKPKGRKLIAKTKQEDLEDFLVEFYAQREKKEKCKHSLSTSVNIPIEEITLETLYKEWLIYKNLKATSSSYTKRIECDWLKYYAGTKIITIPLVELDYLTLDKWAHTLIKSKKLTKTQYYNLTVIVRQVLDYAVDNKIIDYNPFSKVKISAKSFEKRVKPKDETQVFSKKDEKELCDLIFKKFKNRPWTISGLAIAFNFNLGLRVGELVTLKWSDIEDNYIHIQRSEVANYVMNEETGEQCREGVIVTNHAKTEAGNRWLYLPVTARNILQMVKNRNEEYGYYDEDYIFISCKGTRLRTSTIDTFLYDICDEMNATRKSSHKIRKTFISSLFDTGMNINKIREIAGHEDERTSLHNYCFNRRTDEDVEKMLETISDHKQAIS